MNRAMAAMLVAILLGGVSMVAVRQYLQKQKAPIEQDRTRILRAVRDIRAGDLIATQVYPDEVPKQVKDAGVFYGDADRPMVAVMRARVDIKRGQGITPYMVYEPGTGPRDTKALPYGQRLMTIAVDPETGIAGHVSPGDRVDAVVTLSTPSGAQGEERVTSRLLLPNLYVYAVDERTIVASDARPGKMYTTVTVQVTPEETELLAFARAKGRITFVLRGMEDHSVTQDPLAPVQEDSFFRMGEEAYKKRKSEESDRPGG